MPASPTALQKTLLAWGQASLRDLPWRATRDPWTVLVSETMLQQTQVSRVAERLPQFLASFPTASACAAAPAAAVLREWEGLGYNRRALMLHRCAGAIVHVHGGVVPSDLAGLLALPGVGPYTARAVQAFAFELDAAPVDTNIGRVLARIGEKTLSPKDAQSWADDLVPDGASWLWNQSIMELGATVCTKRSPRCGDCPIAMHCRWQGSGADPAVGSAAVSKPQARFEGSDRQLRGRFIDALRRGPVDRRHVGREMQCDNAARVARIVTGLERDGLIEVAHSVVRLAGDSAS